MIPFVGLTGGIASGKTTAAAHFANLGVPVVDADDVSRSLYGPGAKATRQIGREFGAEFVEESGKVDRSMLRQAVFTDSRLRKRLEAITHPLIRKECLSRMNSSTGSYGLLVAPLLFEAAFITNMLERVLVIDCDEDRQYEHGVARGRFSSEQIKAAMKAQLKREDRIKRADDVIINNGNIENLEKEIMTLHVKYQDLFANS